MKRALHGLILALTGAVLLKLAVTGDFRRYVKLGARPYLIAAAVVLLALAAVSLWQTLSDKKTTTATARNDDHGHAHGRVDVGWLLVVPMLAVLLLAPPALGSFSASRAGTALGAARASALPPLPAEDPARLSVLDYASRAVFDHGRSLTGRHLTLSGFLLPGGHGVWYLTRMVISCCAADAQPIKVGLTGAVPAGLSANQWLRVTGGYTSRTDPDPVNDQTIPYLTVTAASPIPAPAQQYES